MIPLSGVYLASKINSIPGYDARRTWIRRSLLPSGPNHQPNHQWVFRQRHHWPGNQISILSFHRAHPGDSLRAAGLDHHHELALRSGSHRYPGTHWDRICFSSSFARKLSFWFSWLYGSIYLYLIEFFCQCVLLDNYILGFRNFIYPGTHLNRIYLSLITKFLVFLIVSIQVMYLDRILLSMSFTW